MQFIAKLKTPAFLIIIILSFFLNVKVMAQENNLELNYYGKMDRKLNIIMIGANEEFRTAFKDYDTKGMFDHENQPSDLADSDFVAIFLNDWVDASSLPDALDFVKAEILDVADDQVNLFKVYKLKDNKTGQIRRLIISAYNVSKLPGKSYNCYSKDIINGLILTDEKYKIDNIGTCK